MPRRNILEILKERPVLGDGSYGLTLERRGYIAAGIWTPEAVLTHPEAVKQLHRDYLQAGADVLQAFTFFASDGKLKAVNKEYSTELLNQKACDLVWEVAGTDGPLVCGGISPTPSYTQGKGEAAVKAEFAKQCDIFIKNKVDFLIAEYFGNVEEIEWAIEVMKRYNVPVASTLRIGPTGDDDDVSVGDCAVRMARAGADIVGINCNYDPDTCIKTLKMMKARLDEEGLENFIMAQPLGYHCPETENHKDGYYNLPECPLALECRLISRWDAARFAREAFDLGVRYIGGCCGFEPYHIRQMSEELTNERGFSATGVEFCPPNCQGLLTSPFMVTVNRATSDYWKKLSKEMSDKRRNLAE